MSLINPFELFGIDVHGDINMKEVKKIYHSLALMCHPDKGGKKEDFIIIHKAYKYVLEQVEQSKEMIDMDILEEDFKKFCDEQTEEKLPSLLDIRDETALFNKKFNEQWEEQKIDYNDLTNISNPFSIDNGYGNLMEESSIIPEEVEQKDDSCLELKNKFTSEVMIYTEPNALPDTYGSFQRYDVEQVDNYGDIPKELYDYKETHTEYRPTPAIDDKIEDKPINDFEIQLLQRQLERNSLVIEKTKIKLDFKSKK